jgi:Ca2+-binding EF-hand superfamily protein
LAFAALIHKHQPHAIDYDALAASKDNKHVLETAFAAAEKLGISRLLDIEDMAIPEERSVMTYVSEYFHRFAQQDQNEVAARRAAKFVTFARAMQVRKDDYEKRVKALLEWTNTKIEHLSEHKFGDSLEDAIGASDGLKHHLVQDKPPKIAEKLDIENLFAEIQTELQVNNRSAYVPATEVSLETLETAWTKLQQTETSYAAAVRQNRHRFVKKTESKLTDEQVSEIKASFKHFDANGDDALDKTEFKAASAALSVSFKNDEALEKAFKEVSEGKNSINFDQYSKYMRSLQEDRDSPDQLREAFKLLAGDKANITADQLKQPPLSEDDAKFLISVMPSHKDGGYDYEAYLKAHFHE